MQIKLLTMKKLLSGIKISVPEKIFLKDPESSDLGKRIIGHSILLIDEMGFDSFTFKKLGTAIGSNESSIYRYFESKHKLLLYLTSWYWAWMEYQLVFGTLNMPNSKDQLLKAIEIVTKPSEIDNDFLHIDEIKLSRIIVNEYSKSYLTKEVDSENREGYFVAYKRLITRLRDIVLELKPNYKYASSIASTIVQGALHQHFLKAHFQTITDCNDKVSPTDFFKELTLNAIKS